MKRLIAGLLVVLCLTVSVYGQGGAPVPFRKKPASIVFNKAGDSTDVTTALRTALAEATTSRATLVLDSGVYLITDSIVVSNSELVGYNAKLSFVLSGQKKAVVMGNNSAIRGVTIELDSTGTGISAGSDGSYGSAVCVGQYNDGTGYSNISISDLTISSDVRADADGIFVTGRSFNIDITNIHFTKSPTLGRAFEIHWGNALSADTTADTGHTWHPNNIRISNIAIDSMTRTATVTNGIHLSGVYDVSVENVKMQFAARAVTVIPGDYGYRYAFQPDLDTSLIEGQGIVFNNIFADSLTDIAVNITGDASPKLPGGLTADQSSWFMPVHVTNSTFKGDGTGNGVAVSLCRDVVIENCTFEGFNTGVSTGASVYRLKVLGCTIVRNQAHGVQLSDGSTGPVDALVQNCYIADNDKGATDRSQIELGVATRAVIDNNRLGLSSGEGAFAGIELLATGSGHTVTNNYVYGASSVAYSLAGDSTTIIEWRNNRAGAAMTWVSGVAAVKRAIGKLMGVADDSLWFAGFAVDGTAPANGEIPKYNSASGTWVWALDDTASASAGDAAEADTGVGVWALPSPFVMQAGSNMTFSKLGVDTLVMSAAAGTGLWDSASSGVVDTFTLIGVGLDSVLRIVNDSLADSTTITFHTGQTVRIRDVNYLVVDSIFVGGGPIINFAGWGLNIASNVLKVNYSIDIADSALSLTDIDQVFLDTTLAGKLQLKDAGITIAKFAQNGAATNEGFYWNGSAWVVGPGIADSARLLNLVDSNFNPALTWGRIGYDTSHGRIYVGYAAGTPQTKIFYPGSHDGQDADSIRGWSLNGIPNRDRLMMLVDSVNGVIVWVVQDSTVMTIVRDSSNAGTDITVDLEEETHASEHEDAGADEIAVTAGMMNTGTGASNTTYWRGDNTWATPAGGSGTTDSTRLGNGLAVRTSVADSIAAPADTVEVDTAVIATKGLVGLIGDDTTNYQTAYGWGDHSAQGYLTGNQTITLSGDVSGSGATAITTTIGANKILTGMISDGTILEADLDATNAPTDNYVLSYNLGALNFTWIPDASGLGGDSARVLLSDRVDTSTAGLVFNGGNITMSGAETVDGVDVSAHAANASAHHTATVEVNDLEGADPSTILVNEVYIGTGSGAGAFSALSGDVTMNSAGVTTIGANKIGSGHVIDNSLSLPSDLATFTESEFMSQMSDASSMFTNNTTGDVTVVGSSTAIGANRVDSAKVKDSSLSMDDINWQGGIVSARIADGTIKGADIDSTSNPVIFSAAYKTSSATASNELATKGYADSGVVSNLQVNGDLGINGNIAVNNWKKVIDATFAEADRATDSLLWPVYGACDTMTFTTNDSVVYAVGHPGVYYIPKGWMGHRYWGVYTPLSNNCKEDPCIVYSNDGITWDTVKGSDADGGSWGTPVIAQTADATKLGSPGFLSDPDIAFDHEGNMWIILRATYSTPTERKIWAMRATDTTDWTDTLLIMDATVRANSSDTNDFMSPAIYIDTSGRVKMWAVEDTSGSASNSVVLYEADSIAGTWSYTDTTNMVPTNTSTKEIWHNEIIGYGVNNFVSLIKEADKNLSGSGGGLSIATSEDGGLSWTTRAGYIVDSTGSTGAWDNAFLYRASGFWRDEGDHLSLELYYSAKANTGKNQFYTGRTILKFYDTTTFFKVSDTTGVRQVATRGFVRDSAITNQTVLLPFTVLGRRDTLQFSTDSVELSFPVWESGGANRTVTWLFVDSSYDGSASVDDTVPLICNIPYQFQADSIIFWYKASTNGYINDRDVFLMMDTLWDNDDNDQLKFSSTAGLPAADSAAAGLSVATNLTATSTTMVVMGLSNQVIPAGGQIRLDFVNTFTAANSTVKVFKVLLMGKYKHWKYTL